MITRRTLLASLGSALAEMCLFPYKVFSLPPMKTPEYLLNYWERFPEYWDWVKTYGLGRWQEYEHLVQRVYCQCEIALKREPQNARLHFILASLIDKGAGDDELLLSGKILDYCTTAIHLKPGYHEAHALMAQHSSFLSIAAANSQREEDRFIHIAITNARKAYRLQPGNEDYKKLLQKILKQAAFDWSTAPCVYRLG